MPFHFEFFGSQMKNSHQEISVEKETIGYFVLWNTAIQRLLYLVSSKIYTCFLIFIFIGSSLDSEIKKKSDFINHHYISYWDASLPLKLLGAHTKFSCIGYIKIHHDNLHQLTSPYSSCKCLNIFIPRNSSMWCTLFFP